jgi:hypothetical protein
VNLKLLQLYEGLREHKIILADSNLATLLVLMVVLSVIIHVCAKLAWFVVFKMFF